MKFNPSAFPFPVIWDFTAQWFFSAQHAPIINGDLVVRAGEQLLRLDRQSGAVRWQKLIRPDAGDGTCFFQANKLLITDYRRWPERLSGIAAFSLEGQECWRLDLPLLIAPNTIIHRDNEIIIVAVAPGVGQMFYRIGLEEGQIIAKQPLPFGASGLAVVPEGYLVNYHLPSEQGFGLYSLDQEGNFICGREKKAVWRFRVHEDKIIIVARSDKKSPWELALHHQETFECLWTQTLASEAVATTETQFFYITPQNQLTCRDWTKETPLWQTTLGELRIHQMVAEQDLLWCQYPRGCLFFDPKTGQLLGKAEGYFGPPKIETNRLFMTRQQGVICSQWVFK